MLNYLPQYISSRAVAVYIAALLVVSLVFLPYAMKWYWFVFGLIEVIGFFYFSNILTHKWGNYPPKKFQKKVFTTALIIRIVYVIFSYWFYSYMTGSPFEFIAADSHFYDDMGLLGHSLLSQGELASGEDFLMFTNSLALSDSGYPIYLSFIYFLTDDSLFLARIIKAVLSAYMCILIYKLAVRNFGESVGKMAAIFCMLMPNLIYYCGLHLKEVEMVFLAVAFIERADYAMRSPKFTFGNLILPILLAGSLFFFRTVLAAAVLFAFFTAVILAPRQTIKIYKRVVLGAWIAVAVVFFMGGRIAIEVEEVWENRDTNQSTSMEWRAIREGGNRFAENAEAIVFAPMIFTIPFPTMVETVNQENQRFIHGGNYVKNIMSFFTLLAIFVLLFKRKSWRNNSLILAFTCGYLAIIAMSAFAHSERFHMPALPFALMLAAFGVSQMNNRKFIRYFDWWSVIIFVACIGWAYIKLVGRGLVE